MFDSLLHHKAVINTLREMCGIEEERKMVFYNLDTFFPYKNSIYFKHDKINTASLTEATHIH